MQEGCAELVAALGEGCEEVDLPKHFGEAMKLCELVQLAELAKSFDHYARRGRDQLSPEMRQAIDDGNRALARDHLAARRCPNLLNDALGSGFERFEPSVTTGSAGPGPQGWGWTCRHECHGIYALGGVPAVSVLRRQT